MQIRGTEISIYKGTEPFVFVSYSRTDIRTVEGILRILSARGFRLWYDQMGEGIDAGKSWRSVIDERLQASRAFLIFLGFGAADRAEVMREFEMALDKYKADPSYVILPVFLNRIPAEDFPEKVRPFLMENQNIGLWLYGGVTERFVRRLVYAGCWPQEVVDNCRRKEMGLPEWQPGGEETAGAAFGDMRTEEMGFRPEATADYIYRYAAPKLAEKESEGKMIRYYQVGPGEISPHAVYPFVMDNQWCPVSFYEDRNFRKYGFPADGLEEAREKIQRQEICRGLLHARQLLVNRAYLQNSTVFIHWYKAAGTKEYDAFCRLLENGSILLVLYREQMPCEETAYGNTDWEAWKQLCAEHVTYCLRMDWENEENNEMETDKRMGFPFHNYCVTTAENKYRMEEMIRALSLSEEKAEQLKKKWKLIQRKAIRTREETGRGYSRSQFYTDHIIEKGTKVVDCRISARKPFVRELKQMIDMRYNLNFAEAYGIRPLMPGDVQVNPVFTDELASASEGRKVSVEELTYAAGSFHPEPFLASVPMIQNPDLTLDQAEAARQLPQWQRYIRLVEDADSRAKQWDIDFSYIRAVWEEYRKWMEAVRRTLPGLDWKEEKGAVTIIFRIGAKEIRAVYRQDQSAPCVTENEVAPANRRQVLAIDYICGEIPQSGGENAFLTEIRLFEGWTDETGSAVYEGLKGRLEGGGKI